MKIKQGTSVEPTQKCTENIPQFTLDIIILKLKKKKAIKCRKIHNLTIFPSVSDYSTVFGAFKKYFVDNQHKIGA